MPVTNSDRQRSESLPVNPHFEHNRVVWSDEYSGEYLPVPYQEQFDDQWRLFLEQQPGFCRHTGVETSDPYIDDRIADLTGEEGFLEKKKFGLIFPLIKQVRQWFQGAQRQNVGGRLFLSPKFPIQFFQGKRCLDIGCGAGRWTRTMQVLGGKVKSVDVSSHGLEATRKFNEDVEEVNLFDIGEQFPHLHEAFDFTICWGVVMCTHDPKLAFENVARTVQPGGHLYTMTYAPTFHNSPFVLDHRRHYHRQLTTMEEKIQYAYHIADRPENAINLLDMLNTFYNWTVPEEVIHQWYRNNGFTDIQTLNAGEPNFCAYHVLGKKRS